MIIRKYCVGLIEIIEGTAQANAFYITRGGYAQTKEFGWLLFFLAPRPKRVRERENGRAVAFTVIRRLK